MTELGQRLRTLVDRSAPPISGEHVIYAASVPRRPSWVTGLVAAVAILVVGAFSFVFGAWQPGEPEIDPATAIATDGQAEVATSVGATSTVVATTVRAGDPVAIRVDCSGELESFPCSALLDGDLTTSWQISEGIIGARLTFWFPQPVALDSIGFQNISDDTQFMRNHRIRGFEIATDDLADITIAEIPDSNLSTHIVELDTIRTSGLTLTVTSAYPGDQVGDLAPFDELALAEVVFTGTFADPDLIPDAPAQLVAESIVVFGNVNVVPCTGAEMEVRAGSSDGTVYAQPRDALAAWIRRFNIQGFFDVGPPVPEGGYYEMSYADGREGYAYGIPLGYVVFGELAEVPLADATFGFAADDGTPISGLDPLFVVEVRVIPQEDLWTIEYWHVSGC